LFQRLRLLKSSLNFRVSLLVSTPSRKFELVKLATVVLRNNTASEPPSDRLTSEPTCVIADLTVLKSYIGVPSRRTLSVASKP